MNKRMQRHIDEVLEFTKVIAKRIEIITKYKVDTSLQCGIEIESISFYIWMDDNHSRSENKYRLFSLKYKEHMSAESYTECIISNIDNELVYTTGKVCNNAIIVNEFITGYKSSEFYIDLIRGLIFYNREEVFTVIDSYLVEVSVDGSKISIEDKGYCKIFMDLKNNSCEVEEIDEELVKAIV